MEPTGSLCTFIACLGDLIIAEACLPCTDGQRRRSRCSLEPGVFEHGSTGFGSVKTAASIVQALSSMMARPSCLFDCTWGVMG